MIALNQFVTLRFAGHHTQTKEFIGKEEYDYRMYANFIKAALDKELKKDKTRILTEAEKAYCRIPKVDSYKIIVDTSEIGKKLVDANVSSEFELYIPYNGGSNMKVEVLAADNKNITEEKTEVE